MTGAEWRTCANPNEMLRALRQTLPRVPCGGGYTVRTPERKMRLFAVAACSGLRWLFRHDWHRLALDATEEVADAPQRADDTRRVLRDWHRELGGPAHPDNPNLDRAVWSAAFPHEFWEATDALLSRVTWALETAWGNRTPPGPSRADVVREVFGNPFEPAVFAPAWRTMDVILLAGGIYREKTFDRMPILADALQDAGCDSDDILAHLRGAGPHALGCWSLDLVLGKS